MSSPNRLLVLAAALALAGCTAGPLYGTTSVDPATGARSSVLTELRGRIAMLYKLNGATPVSAPLYELRYTVSATDQIAAVEAGTGTPSAALYRMTVDYELIRTADLKSLARGQRFATVPYDRTSQLFAASRAVVDARDQAGETVAERVLGAVAPVIQREAFTDPAPVVSKN
jgi:LPS-assembly lipoprotein